MEKMLSRITAGKIVKYLLEASSVSQINAVATLLQSLNLVKIVKVDRQEEVAGRYILFIRLYNENKIFKSVWIPFEWNGIKKPGITEAIIVAKFDRKNIRKNLKGV
jgi:hypothetical protein